MAPVGLFSFISGSASPSGFPVLFFKKTEVWRSSGQDRGVGRNASLPCTAKRNITTNLKTINNQNCQKIKLHGTPTAKKLKKKSTRTTRPVGEVAVCKGGAGSENPREAVNCAGGAG